MSVFKACDIRGIAGSEITRELFRKFGRGIGMMMVEGKTIVVGGDLRTSTGALKAELIRGLAEGGRVVTDLGAVPTPVVYFAKDKRSAHACAIVTASHNPPQYNGLKFMIGDLPVLPQDVERLRDIVTETANEPASSVPVADLVSRVDMRQDYEDWISEGTDALLSGSSSGGRELAVVIDAGNGTFSEIGPRVFDRTPGITAHGLFCEPDGTFPNRDPNCSVAKNLSRLSAHVREVNADLGIAFDGDGDRVAFADEHGEVIPADEMMMLLLRWLGDRMRGEKFVFDLKCSQVVIREGERVGMIPIMERSGHAFIKRRMITENAAFGGEVSGHYFYRELHGGDDGLFTALLVTRLVQQEDVPLSALRARLPQRFITDDVRLRCAPAEARAYLDRARDAFPADRLNELDGVRISFPRGWALVRVSITEPKITLRFEGEDPASLRENIETFLQVLPELREEVSRHLAES